MKKSILRASAALQAFAVLGAGSAAFIAATPAAAQDYTSGAVIATVTNSSGAPVGGATVTMTSLSQNQSRTFVTNGAGSFSASGLTPGEYSLSIAAPGYQPYEDTLTVTASQESRVTVGLVSTTQSAEITVTGRRLRQTTTQGTTGLNVDVVAVTSNVAVPRNITGLTLLAPTTARGVAGFGDVPSVGGSSVSENAYYINGLNITNPDTYVGSARVPFDFYKTVDVQTGGYPAEFGRATGGVINATTKSGSNIPFVALHVNWQPSSLQSHPRNLGDPTAPVDVGHFNEVDRKSVSVEAGGALVPDHLFLYGLIEAQRNTVEFASAAAGSFRRQKNNDPFWGVKADAYITPTQHAEFTMFDTRSTTKDVAYHFTPNADNNGGTIGSATGTRRLKSGGLNWVARYTGDITDFFTVSGAYGINKDAGDTLPLDTQSYYVTDRRTATTGGVTKVVSEQQFTTNRVTETRRRFYRADGDLRFSAAGHHHIRFGFDNEDLSETKTVLANGALPIIYGYSNTGILITYENLGGHISARDTAYYAQDAWETPIQGLTLNLGIRDDEFNQVNLSGEKYLDLTNNIGLRLGFSYSPPALDKWKFFGNYGRYFIPPAMNLGFRGRDLYFQEYFSYPDGPANFQIDPVTGLPLQNVGPARTDIGALSTQCPAVDLTGAPGGLIQGGKACVVYGAGVQDPALAKLVPGTKATYEDEFILGTRYRASNLLSVGLTGTYRVLKRVSEDTDFGPYLGAKFCGQGSTINDYGDVDSDLAPDPARCAFYQANSAYYIWNPGSSSITLNDWYSARNGEVVPVNLTGLQFPKPKRTYKAIVLDFNRADDGRWQAGGSITWSKLKGSTEGTVKSDAGATAQTDAGSTTDFDYLGLSDYSYGLLPNDHRWAFKLFGAYHFNKIFTLGANIFVQSPMHGSCEGIHPTDPYAAGYYSNSFYCSKTLVTLPDGSQVWENNVPSPRGTGYKSDWLKQVDLSARVNLPFGDSDNRKVVFRADVFNVFNSHAVTQRYNEQDDDFGDEPNQYIPATTYLTPQSYQTPRYVRLGLDVIFGGAAAAPPPPVEIAPPPPPPPAPPPATQTCSDGSVILATDACPVPPPPPPPPAPAPERGY